MRELASIPMTPPHELQSDNAVAHTEERDEIPVTKLTQLPQRLSLGQELQRSLTIDPLLRALSGQASWNFGTIYPKLRRSEFWRQPAVCLTAAAAKLLLIPCLSTSFDIKTIDTTISIPDYPREYSSTSMWYTSSTKFVCFILSSIASSLSRNSTPKWTNRILLPQFFWSVL